MEKLDNLVIKLKSVPYYPALFNAAFGSPDITAGRIADALAQFLRSMQSFNSKFDQGVGSNFSNFSPQEFQGEALFRQFHCNSCHGGNNLNNGGMAGLHNMDIGNDWANDGLDANNPDPGLMDVSGQAADNGVFKVPSLRNIEMTYPYMHDGRYRKLKDVLNYYGDPGNFMTGAAKEMQEIGHLSERDKKDLLAFLLTLTDKSFIYDRRFVDPFMN